MSKSILCISILTAILCTRSTAAAQSASVADSLFEETDYLGAYRVYAKLHTQAEHKPVHLLRMAYIQESLQQYPKALYHLMDYYLRHQDVRVWEKITTLSKARRMTGYELTESEFMLLWILSHKDLLFLGGGLVWILFVLLCLRKKGGSWQVTGLILCSLYLIFLLERELWLPKRAVLLTEAARLHKGPSPASPLRTVSLPAGLFLRVEESSAIWTEVKWSGSSGYLPTRQLGLLRFD